METVVSVIVPVYKVEDCLDRCVESIAQQTWKNLEILLVDDGSPDRCPALCDAWAERDKRVRVIHKKNEGVGKARNTGMEFATGEYILFVDSDDYLPADAVEVLLDRLRSDGSDMAIGRNLMVFEDGRMDGSLCDFMQDTVLTADEFLNSVGGTEQYSVAPWGKLYTRKALEGIEFPPLICGEDLWVFPLIVLQCTTVSVVDHLVYYYFQRSASTMHSKVDKHNLSAIRATQHMTAVFLERGQIAFAAKWFVSGIELVEQMKDLRSGVEWMQALFRKEQIREMRKYFPLPVRVKWQLLYCPAAYRWILGTKRALTARPEKNLEGNLRE